MANKPEKQKYPPGLTLRHTLRGHKGLIYGIAWSPDGRTLASGSSDNTIRLWDGKSGELCRTLAGHSGKVYCVSWSPDGRTLASGSSDNTIRLWNTESGKLRRTLEGHTGSIYCVSWSPDRRTLASGSYDNTIRLWDDESGKLHRTLKGHPNAVCSVSWAPDGRILASGSSDKTICLWDSDKGEILRKLVGHTNFIWTVAWSPDGKTLASGGQDNTIRLWNPNTGQSLNVLEGHTNYLNSVSFSSDGSFIASKSWDNYVRIWRIDTKEVVTEFDEPSGENLLPKLAFHPSAPVLATLGEKDRVIRIWDLDYSVLLGAEPATKSVHYTSAKIVLVGESNVGKSCLGLRLAEDRYEEQGTTHGMRFWPMKPEQLSPDAAAPAGEKRDVVLWDMGGQDEYRLVHQLFLHDTTLALILLDPTRGRTAFEEVEGWNNSLEKQLQGRKIVKLLVGTKQENPSTLVDRAAIERLKEECKFDGYFEVSAKNGRGIEEFKEALSRSLDWDMLAKITRSKLFQCIRDVIERKRADGEVVLLASDLKEYVRKEHLDDFESAAVNAVIEQLAIQGVIADTKLSSGERALVLQICEVERYACSIIIAARDNQREVPAIEEQEVVSPRMNFPGIAEKERLPRLQERIVIECVIQFLLKFRICLKHERLLLFPSLFSVNEQGERRRILHSIPLYYDFSGAIDNIYSSLINRLAVSGKFGWVRLGSDEAEFEQAGRGVCGLRKISRKTGLAHLDLYFNDQTPDKTRDLFTVFIEEHLRRKGVKITEVLDVTCACGYSFRKSSLQKRFKEGLPDIICPECEKRNHISEGAQKALSESPTLGKQLIALKTVIDKKSKKIIKEVKEVFKKTDSQFNLMEPLRILHLSDLHMTENSDPMAMFNPLSADLQSKNDGLGYDYLDYLVISGDLCNRGKPEEFEKALRFISMLVDRFKLTAQRCIIVPGNHDLDWDVSVYEWKGKRLVDTKKLKKGTFTEQGDGYLLKNDKNYPQRLISFSKDFYHPLIQKPYPLEFDKQCLSFLFQDTGIQFITMNSSWNIDEYFSDRSSINPGALPRGLEQADEQIKQAIKAKTISPKTHLIRIAVWHHPVTGNDKIIEDSFLEQLKKANVKLCLHGHVHEETADLIGYLHPKTSIHAAGAGSFGAPVADRPESTPRLYNVLEVARDHSRIRIHTRCMRKSGGAWGARPVRNPDEPGKWQAYYDIVFRGDKNG